jgi:hypothetical protein
MDAETLEKATQPFFTTKGVGKGTGLGLPMIQGLMAQSGGRLVMNSAAGKGTTAELWLPMAAEAHIPQLSSLGSSWNATLVYRSFLRLDMPICRVARSRPSPDCRSRLASSTCDEL